MTKVVYVMFRREGMSREEFSCYLEGHPRTDREADTGALKEYVQNHALVDHEGNEPP